MMLDTTQSCTQNNTSKCAYQIRERCGLNLGTIWIKSGSCVSCSRYHVGCTQVPCGLHPGTMWAAPRYHVVSIWASSGYFVGSICAPHGYPLFPHMGPIRCPFATPIWGQAGKTHIGPTWKTTLGPSGTHLGVLAGVLSVGFTFLFYLCLLSVYFLLVLLF